ncbi:hypothetical protein D3C78_1358450 [compost metagenome]
MRQDGPPQGLRAGHANARGGFPLTAFDRADRRSQDFTNVGRHVQRKADQGSGDRIEFDPHLWQAEIDHEQLHQQRRAAKKRHVDAGNPVRHFEARQTHQRQAEAEQEAEEHATEAEDDREVHALEQKGHGLPYDLESCFHYLVTSALKYFSESLASVPSARSFSIALFTAANSSGSPLRKVTPAS